MSREDREITIGLQNRVLELVRERDAALEDAERLAEALRDTARYLDRSTGWFAGSAEMFSAQDAVESAGTALWRHEEATR